MLHAVTVQDLCELLLKFNADTELKTQGGCTPLHRAAEGGHFGAAAILLHAKADANARNTGGWTPLHDAALEGKPDNVKVIAELLQFKAKVDAQDRNGATALHFAISDTKAGAVEALLSAGADPDVKDKAGKTAHRIAFECGASQCTSLLHGKGRGLIVAEMKARASLSAPTVDLAQAQEMFARYATDGEIIKDDFPKLASALGLDVSQAKLDALWDRADADKTGTVDFAEFLSLYLQNAKGNSPNNRRRYTLW